MNGLSGLSNWLQSNVLTVVILVLGLGVLTKAHSGNHKAALTSVAVLLLGLFVVGMSVPGAGTSVGTWLVHLVGF